MWLNRLVNFIRSTRYKVKNQMCENFSSKVSHENEILVKDGDIVEITTTFFSQFNDFAILS